MAVAKRSDFEPHTAFVRWLVDWVELDWDDEFVSGDDDIDRQHKDLFELTNRLVAGRDGGLSASQVRAVLAELKEHAVAHFRVEERLLEQHGYPDVQRHAESHDEFRQTVAVFEAQLDRAGRGELTRMIDELEGWIRDHVRNDDKDALAFMRAAR